MADSPQRPQARASFPLPQTPMGSGGRRRKVQPPDRLTQSPAQPAPRPAPVPEERDDRLDPERPQDFEEPPQRRDLYDQSLAADGPPVMQPNVAPSRGGLRSRLADFAADALDELRDRSSGFREVPYRAAANPADSSPGTAAPTGARPPAGPAGGGKKASPFGSNYQPASDNQEAGYWVGYRGRPESYFVPESKWEAHQQRQARLRESRERSQAEFLKTAPAGPRPSSPEKAGPANSVQPKNEPSVASATGPRSRHTRNGAGDSAIPRRDARDVNGPAARERATRELRAELLAPRTGSAARGQGRGSGPSNLRPENLGLRGVAAGAGTLTAERRNPSAGGGQMQQPTKQRNLHQQSPAKATSMSRK
jgi:hypothetical protein